MIKRLAQCDLAEVSDRMDFEKQLTEAFSLIKSAAINLDLRFVHEDLVKTQSFMVDILHEKTRELHKIKYPNIRLM